MLIDKQEYKDKLLRAIADYHKGRKTPRAAPRPSQRSNAADTLFPIDEDDNAHTTAASDTQTGR